MPSSRAVEARPVRVWLKSRRIAAVVRSISLRSSSTTSSVMAASMHDGADGFAGYGAFDVASGVQIEDDDRHGVLHAQGNGSGVHDFQVPIEKLDVAELVE